jgi:hypothetical protein
MALETISNPKAISNLYDDPLILEKAWLHALELSPNNPFVKIHVRIESAPQKSPVRWGKPNKTVLEMQLLDVKDLRVSAWHPNEPTPIKIRREENGSISLMTSDNSLSISCGWIYVARVHPYGGKQNADGPLQATRP